MNRKLAVTLGVAALALAVGGFMVARHPFWETKTDGFALANGRLEVRRYDVATKYPGRVDSVTVREGADVRMGDILASLDPRDIQARLEAAKAAVAAADDAMARAEAEVRARQAQAVLADQETHRIERLIGDEAVSRSDLDHAHAEQALAAAAVAGARAALAQATSARDAARAQQAEAQAARDDMVLRAPISGRVEYRVVEPGTVVGAGSRVVTLLDPSDVRMVVFLPTGQVSRLAVGAPARLVLDGPGGTILPAHVSFISSDAQFTPRAVETASERDKLMYRVELALDPQTLAQARIHGGLTGEAYVRLDPRAPWPQAATQAPSHGR